MTFSSNLAADHVKMTDSGVNTCYPNRTRKRRFTSALTNYVGDPDNLSANSVKELYPVQSSSLSPMHTNGDDQIGIPMDEKCRSTCCHCHKTFCRDEENPSASSCPRCSDRLQEAPQRPRATKLYHTSPNWRPAQSASLYNNSFRTYSNSPPFWGYKVISVAFLLVACLNVAECCSSKSTPKPRPSSPTHRPNVTFQTYTCPPDYAAMYCLNGATCFFVKVQDSILYNCECAEGYMGPRCEFKDLDGSYSPARNRVILETASLAGGACAALLVTVVLSVIYMVLQRINNDKKIDPQEVSRTNLDIPKPNLVCYAVGSTVYNVPNARPKSHIIDVEEKRPVDHKISPAFTWLEHPPHEIARSCEQLSPVEPVSVHR